MTPKNSLKQKPSTRINVKRVVFYGALVSGTMLGVYFLLITLGFFGASATATAQYTPGTGPIATGFAWSKQLTVDHTKVSGSNDFTDFPLLVHVTDPELKHVSFGGLVEHMEGFDIAFAGANGALLEHQLESYDPSQGELIVWIKIPTLFSSVDTQFDMIYGTPGITTDPSTANVWSGGYISVWHMDENLSSSTLTDVSGVNNGHGHQMDSTNVIPGVVGYALDFNGSNERIALENINYSTQGCIQALTVTAWVNTTHNSGGRFNNWSILDFDRSEYFNVYVHGNGKAGFSSRGGTGGIKDFDAGVAGQLNDGNWHHIAMVFDGVDKHVYIDGALVATDTDPHNGSFIGKGNVARYGFIGDGSEATSFDGNRNNRHYDGGIDEIHFAEVGFSADWIATEYNNQISPETFVTIQGATVPLPIELTAFDAKLMGEEVEVKWEVASQINNDYFTVERSGDGENFEPIGQIPGAGNSSAATTYKFMDVSPLKGMNYYRLKQTDFNGDYEVFDVKTVELKESMSVENDINLKVYPNPFEYDFTVQFELFHATEVMVQLYNASGVEIHAEMLDGEIGVNSYKYYQGQDLIEGLYIVNLIADNKVIGSSKIIKK
jgi:hypothetical protein